MHEAFVATFLVAGEAAIAFALAGPLLRAAGLERARRPLAVSLGFGLALAAVTMAAAEARGVPAADLAVLAARFRQLYALALAVMALLLRASEGGTAGPARPARPVRRAAAELALLAFGLLWAAPEGAALGSALRELAVLRRAVVPISLGAALGALAATALGTALTAALRRVGATAALPPSAALALLFALKLSGPAAAAVDATPLAASLTAAVSRLLHDAMHMGFVFLQIPDHPFLRDGAYQLILVFFDPLPHAALAAVLLALPLAAAWVSFARRPAPPMAEGVRLPERRLVRATFLRRGRVAGVAFAAAIALAMGAVGAAHARNDELYEPVPEPAVDDGHGWVVVPLQTGPRPPGGERMRKWIYTGGGHAVTFMAVRRPDGVLAIALDLCDICQPKGYAQLGTGYVFCKYCKTPIPAGAVGQRGGCNPIPLPAAIVDGALLRIPVADLLAAARGAGKGGKP